MNRIWSLLFLLVPVFGIAAFVLAARNLWPLQGAWLPENFSESGVAIDELWYLVHWICGGIFVLTGVLITWMVWRFASQTGVQAKYFQSSVSLELAWSIIPAAILIGLAWYQMNAWSAQRVERPVIAIGQEMIDKPELVRVVAKQFGWEFHYAGADGKFETLDDFVVENLMKVPADEIIVMRLTSRDVIHSFFVPQLRLKHDVVPGRQQTAWFKPLSPAKMEIVCAELCGWGHYKMVAKLEIVSRREFESWIAGQQSRYAAPELEPYSESQP